MRLFCGKNRGAISVFLTLILVPVLLFCGIIVDASRLFASKTVISGAGELTMNAALSQYDKTLKDKYGLTAMAKTPDSPSVLSELEQFFKESCNASYLEGESSEGLHSMIQLEPVADSFSAKGVEGSSLAETNVLEQQIIEYMKFRGPVYIVDEIIEKFKKLPLDNMEEKQEYVEKKSEYGTKAAELQEPLEKAKSYIDAHADAVSALGDMKDGQLSGWVSQYKSQSVFWLAAKSLENYLGYSPSSIASLGKSELTVDEVKGYLGNQVSMSTGQTTFSDAAYGEMIELLALYQSRDTLSEGLTLENGFTEGEIDTFWNIETVIKNNINTMLQINKNFVSEYKSNLSAIEAQADAIIENGESALDELKQVRKKWEKVKSAKEEYEASKKALTDKGEDISGLENEKENIDIDEEDLAYLEECIEANIQGAKNAKEQLSKYKKLPDNLMKVDVSGAEGEWIADYGSASAVERFWSANASQIDSPQELSVSFTDVRATDFYKEQLDGIKEGEEQESAKESQKENREKAEESRTEYKDLLDSLKNAKKEKNLKKYEKITYPDDFPSGLAKASPSSGVEADLSADLSNDSENVQASAGNIGFVASLVNMLDSLGGKMLEQAYLMEYMTEMFNCITTKEGDTSLSGDSLGEHYIYNGEMEYILFGNAQTGINKTLAVGQVFALRLAIDSVYVFTNKELNSQADAVASGISAATGQAWLYPIVKYGYLFCRALYMAGKETSSLVQGNEENIWPDNDDVKLSYKEYLKIFILLELLSDSKKNQLVARTGDCIQFNTGESLKEKYTMLTLSAKVKTSTTFWPKVPQFLGKGTGSDDGKKIIQYSSVLAY